MKNISDYYLVVPLKILWRAGAGGNDKTWCRRSRRDQEEGQASEERGEAVIQYPAETTFP